MMVTRSRFIWILLLSIGAFLLITILSMGMGSGKTIIVDDDGEMEFTDIQNAVDHAEPGDTIRVWEGNYSENVIVNKSISIVGNGSKVTTITSGNSQITVIHISSDVVVVSGFTIIGMEIPHPQITQFPSTGVSIASYLNVVSDLRIRYVTYGILLIKSDSNKILNNTIDHCQYGIQMTASTGNLISGNSIYSIGRSGMDLTLSNGNDISENSISNSSLSGLTLRFSLLNEIEKNILIKCGSCGIFLTNSINNSIFGNQIQNNDKGIALVESKDNNMRMNHVQINQYGIHVSWSTRSLLQDNEYSNNAYGLYLYNSHKNKVNEDVFLNNSQDIVLDISDNNNLYGMDPSIDILIIESQEDTDDSFHITFPMIMVAYIIIITIIASIFFKRNRKNG